MRLPFDDRRAAGRALAEILRAQRRHVELVLALPRGGVPVGFEIARAFGVPLDVFVVRKLGTPGQEELAMGAIASGGTRIMNEAVVEMLRIPERAVEAVVRRELIELERRERIYRDNNSPEPVFDRHVLLVDDGLATGASMRAAAAALGEMGPASVTVAVPVAAAETCAELESEVDSIICAATPEPFVAVGLWYRSFPAVPDSEVRALLREAKSWTTDDEPNEARSGSWSRGE